jgi:hypothetical protein
LLIYIFLKVFLLCFIIMPATPPSTPPSTPPPASFPAGAILATPPTSPQLAQQAARHEERNLRIMGSPEQRRTPAGPSTSAAATGPVYHHLPADLAAQLAALPPMPARPSRQSTRPSVSLNYLLLCAYILNNLLGYPCLCSCPCPCPCPCLCPLSLFAS